MNHPKNDRLCSMRLAEGKVREDHQRRPAASSIEQTAGLCLKCVYFKEAKGRCEFGIEGKKDCPDYLQVDAIEDARTTGTPPRGWRCPKCGSLTDAFVCQECGAGWVLDA